VSLFHPEARRLVDLYFECRDAKRLPFSGSMMEQTAFTEDAFSYLDQIVSEYLSKENERLEQERTKLSSSAQKGPGGGR